MRDASPSSGAAGRTARLAEPRRGFVRIPPHNGRPTGARHPSITLERTMFSATRQRFLLVGLSIAAAAIFLSACGSAVPAAGPGTTPPALPVSTPPVTTPPTPTPAPAPSPTPKPKPAPKPAGPRIGTGSIMGLGTILRTNTGFTLYHLTTDSSSMTSCTGGCAQAWPPLLLPKGVDRVVSGGRKGFATIMRPGGGRQVTYRGMPLYTYAGDA